MIINLQNIKKILLDENFLTIFFAFPAVATLFLIAKTITFAIFPHNFAIISTKFLSFCFSLILFFINYKFIEESENLFIDYSLLDLLIVYLLSFISFILSFSAIQIFTFFSV